MVLQSATQATRPTPHATGEYPNPCRGIADTSPFLAGPVFPALTAPRRRRHRESLNDLSGPGRAHRWRVVAGYPVVRWFLNSTIVACLVTTLTLVVSTLAAYGFSRTTFPGRRVLFGILIAGILVPPQVLIDVNHRMAIMTEETFGPAVGVMSVDSDEQAITLMNDSRY